MTGTILLRDLRRESDRRLLDHLHADVLSAAFDADELDPVDAIAASLTGDGDPTTYGMAALEGDVVVGGLIAEHYRRSNVMLISYLAVAEAMRGRGLGPVLLAGADSWHHEHGVALTVAEIHDPRRYGDGDGHDAWRRLSFYSRLGAMLLGLRFVQPALDRCLHRVPDLLLLAVNVAPDIVVLSGSGRRVDPAPLRRFVHDYYEVAEGRVPGADDAEFRMIQAHLDGPVALLHADEIDRIPPPAGRR